MVPNSRQAVEALVMRMQGDFLESPTLKLTAHDAEQRFRDEDLAHRSLVARPVVLV